MAVAQASPGRTRVRVHPTDTATNTELMNTLRKRLNFTSDLIFRVLELFAENEKLKKEVKARRKQADTWRRRFKKG